MGWPFELDICFLLTCQYVFCQCFYDLYLTTEAQRTLRRLFFSLATDPGGIGSAFHRAGEVGKGKASAPAGQSFKKGDEETPQTA